MASSNDTQRASHGLFGALRDVLFEVTPDTPAQVSTFARPGSEPLNSEALKAARAVLRQSLAQKLGPAVQEFTLQIEALREALPDAGARQRAALRVLSLKSISVQTLVLELERALSALSEQQQAFTVKLGARQTALEEQRAQANQTYRDASAQAELAIVRLQAELDAERAKIVQAETVRQQTLAESERALTELAEKRVGFEQACLEIQNEYVELKQNLTSPEPKS